MGSRQIPKEEAQGSLRKEHGNDQFQAEASKGSTKDGFQTYMAWHGMARHGAAALGGGGQIMAIVNRPQDPSRRETSKVHIYMKNHQENLFDG